MATSGTGLAEMEHNIQYCLICVQSRTNRTCCVFMTLDEPIILTWEVVPDPPYTLHDYIPTKIEWMCVCVLVFVRVLPRAELAESLERGRGHVAESSVVAQQEKGQHLKP